MFVITFESGIVDVLPDCHCYIINRRHSSIRNMLFRHTLVTLHHDIEVTTISINLILLHYSFHIQITYTILLMLNSMSSLYSLVGYSCN